MLALPPLIRHLPDCFQPLGSRRLAPKSALEIGARLGRHDTVSPLRATSGSSFFAGHIGIITRAASADPTHPTRHIVTLHPTHGSQPLTFSRRRCALPHAPHGLFLLAWHT